MATRETVTGEVPLTKGAKVLRTVFLVLVWLCLGLFLEITGPTLIDLKIKTGADYEEVAVAVSGRSVGYFIGSAIGGVLVDKWLGYGNLMIGVCLTGGALATVLVPWCRVVELLWFVIVIQGTFEGVINIVGQKLILILWKEHAASPLHILHGGFGIGSFIVPLIANPFLAVPKPVNREESPGSPNATTVTLTGILATAADSLYDGLNATNDKVKQEIFQNGSWPVHDVKSVETDALEQGFTNGVQYITESRIEYAYLISAVITLALSVVFYWYHCKGTRITDLHKNDNSEKSSSRKTKFLRKCKTMINPATCADGRFFYGLELFTVLFIFYFNIVGGERILGKFIRAYAIEQMQFSVSEGSYINTGFWISFASGRILGFVVARYIPIRKLILIENGGLMVTTILLNIFAVDSPVGLWVLTVPLGLFHSPCFPSMMGWADHHVRMTGMAITLLLLGGSVGGVVYLKITGYLFQEHGARAFLYHLLGYGIASLVLAIVLDLIGAQHGSRFTEEPKKDVEFVDLEKKEALLSEEGRAAVPGGTAMV